MTIASLHQKFITCTGISIDSRSIKKGQMFFALKGPNFDGHKYIDSALASGAKYAIIDNEDYKKNPNTILVTDSEKSLQDLARYHRSTLDIPFIGLTGSNGKTTTKELMSSVLRQKYNVFATKGNLNNHLGVPLSVLSINNTHDVAIIEMGANHIGEIKFLSEISMPEYGLITNIGKAHLEGFGSIEGVRKGKTELYDYIRLIDGQIFYNSSDKNLSSSIFKTDRAIAYDSSDIEILESFPHLKISYKGCEYKVKLSGAYNATNMVAAITIGHHFNIKNELIAQGLSMYTPSNNRSEIKKTKKNLLILDAYNANPSSMKVSIENLYKAEAENKTLIVGHMLELGETSKNEHQTLINYIEKLEFNSVILIGREFHELSIPSNFEYFENTNSAIIYLSNNPIINNTILLKGSRGIALEKLIPSL